MKHFYGFYAIAAAISACMIFGQAWGMNDLEQSVILSQKEQPPASSGIKAFGVFAPNAEVKKAIHDKDTEYIKQFSVSLPDIVPYFMHRAQYTDEDRQNAINILDMMKSLMKQKSYATTIDGYIQQVQNKQTIAASSIQTILNAYDSTKFKLQFGQQYEYSSPQKIVVQQQTQKSPIITVEQPTLPAPQIPVFAKAEAQFPSIEDEIEQIINASSATTDKIDNLQKLYAKHLQNKPQEPREKTVVLIKGKPSQFKRALAEWLKIDTKLKITIQFLSTGALNTNESALPQITAADLQNSLIDISQSSIFTEENKPTIKEAHSTFQQTAASLTKQLDLLISLAPKDLGTVVKSIIKLKEELVNKLDEMSTFIFEYDLNPQEKDAAYQSERCWMLGLIKETIINNNNFTTEMIIDWQKQIQNIVIITQKSVSHKVKGTDFAGTQIELEQLVNQQAAEVKIKKQKNKTTKEIQIKQVDSEQKNISKSKIDELDAQIKKNIYNTDLLNQYLSALKEYKKMLVPAEKQENKKITQFIQATEKKIKRLTIIAPRKKTDDEKKLSAIIGKTTFTQASSLAGDAAETMRLALKALYDDTGDQKIKQKIMLYLQNLAGKTFIGYGEPLGDANTEIPSIAASVIPTGDADLQPQKQSDTTILARMLARTKDQELQQQYKFLNDKISSARQRIRQEIEKKNPIILCNEELYENLDETSIAGIELLSAYLKKAYPTLKEVHGLNALSKDLREELIGKNTSTKEEIAVMRQDLLIICQKAKVWLNYDQLIKETEELLKKLPESDSKDADKRVLYTFRTLIEQGTSDGDDFDIIKSEVNNIREKAGQLYAEQARKKLAKESLQAKYDILKPFQVLGGGIANLYNTVVSNIKEYFYINWFSSIKTWVNGGAQ